MKILQTWRKKQEIPEPVSEEEMEEIRRRQEIIAKKLDTYQRKRKGKGQQWTANS